MDKTNQEINEEILNDIFKKVKLSPATQKNYLQQVRKFNETTFDNIEKNLQDILNIIKNATDKTGNYNPNNAEKLLNVFTLVYKNTDNLYDLHEGAFAVSVGNIINDIRINLKTDIDNFIKEKNKVLNETLPTYQDLQNELDKSTGLKYIVNYLLMNYGFRNSDFAIKIIYKKSDMPNDTEFNYLYINPSRTQVKLIINNYKTARTYGKKEFTITDKAFYRAVKDFPKFSNILFTTKSGDKMSDSYLGDVIQKLSILGLGEGRIFKIMIKHYFDTNQHDKIEQLEKSRGTKIATIFKNYNVFNN